jgi:osmotically-inducible protein OsmY
VTDGHARLMGDVDNGEQYWRADEIVANSRGIESLTNVLTIGGEVPHVAIDPYMDMPRLMTPGPGQQRDLPSDRSLHSAVESELFWSPFVDEEEVEIDVEDGTVTLTGIVDSTSESVAAAENAFQAGAVTVNNRLEVEDR